MVTVPLSNPNRIFWRLAAIGGAAALLLAMAAPVSAHEREAENEYAVHKLVSDVPGRAAVTDPNLVNGWGITASPMSPWWVSNNGTETSTLYNGAGTPFPVGSPLVVHMPKGAAPTGTVFNLAGGGFNVTNGTTSGSSVFLFASENGQVLGWNPGVSLDAIAGYKATDGAIYKGLAIGGDTTNGFHLFAADFHNGKVDVLDSNFHLLPSGGKFMDPRLPAGYAPFGIQNLAGRIFVTYAKQDSIAKDEVDGQGRGYVSVFGTDGTFQGRVASRGVLNAPWGLAWAPSNFGKFSGDLLVGNFGNGRIHAFAWNGHRWVPRGTLLNTRGRPIVIDGLWGIGFGNGVKSGPTNSLYFAAGPNHEAHGLFGSITASD
jgi:uncharacterized protein (TIGR03118 family)